MLKEPCEKAIVISGVNFNSDCNHNIKELKGNKKIINIMVPIKLNKTWAAATRLAAILEPMAAKTAVIQVPIFDPNKIGIAPCKVKKPPENSPR